MRKLIINTMATTGIALVILAFIGALLGAVQLAFSGIFETFGACFIINAGLLLIQRFESKYVILEATLDVGYTVIVLILFGALFNWYSSIPIWVLLIMAVTVYLLGMLLSMFRVREDINTINQLLQKRDKNNREGTK